MLPVRIALGCDEPEDDLPEMPANCATCAAHENHGEPEKDELSREHGQWYVGVAGYGFRTNRCPRSWASTDFAASVGEGLRWTECGMVASVYGLQVPYRLVEAVDTLRLEINAVRTEVARKEREAAIAEARRRELEGK